MDAVAVAIQSVIYILPAYFANATPVLLGGGSKLDGGRNFCDGKRLFGDGKTVRGFLAGIFAGVLAGAMEGAALAGTGGQYDIYAGSMQTYVLAGFLLGLGTMLGDLLGSFIKRRQGTAQGKPSFLLDQLAFLILAIALSYSLAAPFLTLPAILFLLVLTYFVHIGANVLANRLGLKKVPW